MCCEYLVCKDVSLSDRSAVALILKEKIFFPLVLDVCSVASDRKLNLHIQHVAWKQHEILNFTDPKWPCNLETACFYGKFLLRNWTVKRKWHKAMMSWSSCSWTRKERKRFWFSEQQQGQCQGYIQELKLWLMFQDVSEEFSLVWTLVSRVGITYEEAEESFRPLSEPEQLWPIWPISDLMGQIKKIELG